MCDGCLKHRQLVGHKPYKPPESAPEDWRTDIARRGEFYPPLESAPEGRREHLEDTVGYHTTTGSGGMPPPSDRVIGERRLRRLAQARDEAREQYAATIDSIGDGLTALAGWIMEHHE